MEPRTPVLLAAVALASVGCIGLAGDEVEPSPSSQASNVTSNETQTPEPHLYEENFTLEWTHVRWGTYDNVVVDGQNCVWVKDVSSNVTIQRIHVEANWSKDGPVDGVQTKNRLQLWIQKASLPYLVERRGIYEPPMNEAIHAWRQVPDDDNPFYGDFGWLPDRAREAHVAVEVDMTLGFEYVPDEPGNRMTAVFWKAICQ